MIIEIYMLMHSPGLATEVDLVGVFFFLGPAGLRQMHVL